MNSVIKSYVGKLISLLLLLTMIVNLTACSVPRVKAADLMKGISPNTVTGKAADDRFLRNTADFSIELFKKSVHGNDNSLISPLSVMLALSMTANGADKETLAQMQKVLGKDITMEELNEYLYTYSNSLPDEKNSKLRIANSIWFRDDEDRLQIEKAFLQTNADYYNADIYKSSFNSQTITDINHWVNTNTEGMIDRLVDRIDADTIMYLINAVVFDARWQEVYEKNDIYSDDFTSNDGTIASVDFMSSSESIYLEDDMATGFMKPYYNNKYQFVALLPKEGVSIEDYIASLTGEKFMNTMANASMTNVSTAIPKFSYDYTINMNNVLKALGMPKAFAVDKADFSKMGKSSEGNISIGEVLHKAFISVDELGTKAGAVTKIEMTDTATALEPKSVWLDRPFVYAIIDRSSKLPIFIGAVMSLK